MPIGAAGAERGARAVRRQAPRRSARIGAPPIAPPGGSDTACHTSPVAALPLLCVATLGQFALWRGAEALPTGGWATKNAGVLFTALLSSRGKRLRRDEAIDLLWPESDLASATGSLRELLSRLRRICGGDVQDAEAYIRNEDPFVGLAPGAVWIDADHFEREAETAIAGTDPAACAAAIALYRGEYLPHVAGDHLRDHAALIKRRRIALQRTYARLLEHAAALLSDADPRTAADYLRRAFAIDPTNEHVARRLMAQLAATGEPARVPAVFNALARALARERGLTPSHETREARDRLLPATVAPPRVVAGGVPTMLAVAGAGAAPAPVVAVVTAHAGAALTAQARDGVWCFTFDRPVEALAAAWILASPARDTVTPRGLRVAVHTGELASRAREGSSAPAVLHALLAQAHPGQILVSHATQALVGDSLATEHLLVALDRYQLLSDAPAETIYQLSSTATQLIFPPLAAPRYRPHNLPATYTRYIERPDLQARLSAALTPHERSTSRLLTLTGVGGVGKTRLALHLAHTLLSHFPDGVWLVELAALRDARDLPAQIGRALGLREERGRPYTEIIDAFLRARERPILLVLDNCEHLLSDCAQLIGGLLRASRHVSVLATSRARLGMLGERPVEVPVLALPASAADVARAEAARLFWARAEEADPTFTITGARAGHVAQLCRRLDGIALAIELAAAQLACRPLAEIVAGLDCCPTLLNGGNAGADPRQQTLRATLDWSYRLLSPPARTLFRRLSVFAGGWTLPAAREVCASGDVQPALVEPLQQHLIASSLAHPYTWRERQRYRMLEPVRQYALERLEQGERAGEE